MPRNTVRDPALSAPEPSESLAEDARHLARPDQSPGQSSGKPAPNSQAPIFVLGISPRSGTNFIYDLLLQHPDCGGPGAIVEDYVLARAGQLANYVDEVFPNWLRRGSPPELEDELYESLGAAVLRVMLNQVPAGRLVTKTPSVQNLDLFFRLFPHAYLILLVRDGCDVVESRVRSFYESYEVAIRKWAQGADTILRFVEQDHDPAHRHLVVRYEDLFRDTEPELRKIFAFCDLDPDRYDFAAAQQTPVKGSSVYRGAAQTDVHWKPVEKSADFKPVGRAAHWPASIRRRFDWVAGQQQRRLGYQTESAAEINRVEAIWQRMLDLVKWRGRWLWERPLSWIKGLLKKMFGRDRMTQARRDWLDRRRNRPGQAR